MTNRRRIGSIALVVILLASLLAIFAYAMSNGTNPVGPSTPVPGGGLPTPTPAPTATPQGLTSVLSIDNTTSGFDIQMTGASDQLRFSRTFTAELDARTQTGGIGTLFIPDLQGGVDDIVAEDLTQTLINKTIDGDNNTFVDVKPSQFDNLDAPTDEECATYESDQIEWQPCGSGGERNRAWDRRNTGGGQEHFAACVQCDDGPSTEVGDFQNVIIYLPIFIGQDVDTDEIKVMVNSAGSAGEDARVGIYDSTTDPIHPNNLVRDGGSFAIDSTGIKTITITSTALTANRLYWLALVTESSTVTFNSPGDKGELWSVPLGMDDFIDIYVGRTHAFTCGSGCTNSLPTTASATSGFSTQTGNFPPAIALTLN